tara:strand:+ start:624 stop:836 length:213 start_codon:yes stop_codon:yes gene_type:complete
MDKIIVTKISKNNHTLEQEVTKILLNTSYIVSIEPTEYKGTEQAKTYIQTTINWIKVKEDFETILKMLGN